MELLKDILTNILSDGISFVLGMLYVILSSFLKNPNRIKKLYQNTINYLRDLMNFDYKKIKLIRVSVNDIHIKKF